MAESMEGVVVDTPQQNGDAEPVSEEKTVAGMDNLTFVGLHDYSCVEAVWLLVLQYATLSSGLRSFDY